MLEDSNVRKEALGDIRAVDKEKVISRWPWAVIRSDWLLCGWWCPLCLHTPV